MRKDKFDQLEYLFWMVQDLAVGTLQVLALGCVILFLLWLL